MTRSSRLLSVGVVVLLAGLVVAVLALRGDAAATAQVEEPAPAPLVDPDAVEAAPVAEEEPRLPDPLEVPEGTEAVAVTAVFDRAVADLPDPGDRVNVYAVLADVREERSEGTPTPGAARIVSGVEVLGVASGNADGATGNVTLVLALAPADAAGVVHAASNESLWFSLLGDDDPAAPGDLSTSDVLLDAVG